MPELPDVEGFQAVFDEYALNRRVTQLEAPEPALLEDTTPQGLGRRLHGRTFSESRRYGKYLFGGAGPAGWLVLHFGMTGSLQGGGAGEDRPPAGAVRFHFDDGTRLAYVTQRKLGMVSWTPDWEAYVDAHGLGPDAFDERFGEAQFVERLSQRRGMLKPALMDQSVLAGLGNVWSDEILFQCGLWPKIQLKDLSHDRLAEIYRAMRRILRTGSRVHREHRAWPRGYLVAHRDTDGHCPRCGRSLSEIKVSGRTSRYCSACQTARS